MRFPVLLLIALAALPAAADEGLWLYNQFPPSSALPAGFLDHLRLASVRIGGESGAFVSPKGLILTTRQTAAGCVSETHSPGPQSPVRISTPAFW